MAKKINVDKTETAKDIIAQLIEDDDAEVTLVVPKFSKLAEVESSFKLLKKAAVATGKKLTIESVDDQVVQLAKAVNIEAVNPFFANGNGKPKSWKEIERELELGGEEEFRPAASGSAFARTTTRRRHWWLWLAALIILLVPLYWLAFNVLPRAEIKIVTEKTDWSFNDLAEIKKDGEIPSEVAVETKNAQVTFPATGKKVVSQKAGGKIIIYNAFSSEPQQLVATTRFVTEEGKIYRLVKSVAIPGAEVKDNKITASSIAAEVTADKPGPDYNIGSGKKLTIPGFKSITAKYKGFYGETGDIGGGRIGEVAYPTDNDIKAAKVKIANVLEDALNIELPARLPPGFKLVEGAKQFNLVKANVNPETNESGEFSVIAEGQVKVVGFVEKDLLAYLEGKMKAKLGDKYVFKEKKINYDVAKADFEKEEMSLPVDFVAVAHIPVDADGLRKEVAGKSEKELRELIFKIPGLKSAEVALRPFYVKNVPLKADVVSILVD